MEAQTQLREVIEESEQDPCEVIVEDIVDDGPPDLADQAYEYLTLGDEAGENLKE